jgi:hypothetical protein
MPRDLGGEGLGGAVESGVVQVSRLEQRMGVMMMMMMMMMMMTGTDPVSSYSLCVQGVDHHPPTPAIIIAATGDDRRGQGRI